MNEFPEFWLDINYYIGSVKSYAELRYVINEVKWFFNTEEESLEHILNTLYYKASDGTIVFMYSFPAERDSITLRQWMQSNLSMSELEKIGVLL